MSGPAAVAAVVAVSHNSSRAIVGWLDALAALPQPVEPCVVDSGSRPQELERLRELLEQRGVPLVALPNVGFGRACNAGAAATTAPTVIFSNPDTRILSLPAAVAAGDSIAGTAIGAFDTDPDGRPFPLAFAHLPTARWEALGMLFGRHVDVYPRTAQEPAWLSGAALAMARADVERIGGFSDELFLYFEDADLCARHVEQGGRVRVDPAFRVEHDGASSSEPHGPPLDLDGIGRRSGRIFAARHGRRGDAVLLYLLLVCWYLPRRVAMALAARALGRPSNVPIRTTVSGLLFPSRTMRRLGASR